MKMKEISKFCYFKLNIHTQFDNYEHNFINIILVNIELNVINKKNDNKYKYMS